MALYDGLIHYFKFDEAPGGVVKDEVYTEDAVLTDASIDSAEFFASGLRTDLSTGKAEVPGNKRYRPIPKVTVSVWVNLDKAPSTMFGTNHIIVDKTDSGFVDQGYLLGWIDGNDDITFRVFDLANNPASAVYTEAATSGWIHYVGVATPTAAVLYRNGTQVASGSFNGDLNDDLGTPRTIGLGFEGVIDELAVWRRELSSSEISDLYNAGAGQEIDVQAMASMDLAGEGTPQVTTTSVDYAEIIKSDSDFDLDFSQFYTPQEQLVYGTFDVLSIESPPGVLGRTGSPYPILEPLQFSDPAPQLVDVTVNTDHLMQVTTQIGPTPEGALFTYFEIDTGESGERVLIELQEPAIFNTRIFQNFIFQIPFGFNFNGMQIRYVARAAENANIEWFSEWFVMEGDNFDNTDSGEFTPDPLPPGPPLGDPLRDTLGKPGPGVFRKPVQDFSGTPLRRRRI